MPGRVHVGDASRTCPDTTRIEIRTPKKKARPQAAVLEKLRWFAPPYKGLIDLSSGDAVIQKQRRFWGLLVETKRLVIV